MATFLYVGDDEREFPGDGDIPSLHVNPGDHVEVDGVPDPRYFDLVADEHHGLEAPAKPVVPAADQPAAEE